MGSLDAARAAYARRDWVAARSAYEAVRATMPLGPDDLYALASCAWWLGDLSSALPAHEEAHRRYLDAGQPGRAALVALDTGYTYLIRGDEAQGSGWMRRAVRLLERLPEGVEHGYLRYIEFENAFDSFDLDAAAEAVHRVAALGERFGDETLKALGVLGQGRLLLKQGHVEAGVALLDEAMVAAVSDRLDPGWAGNIYCHLMRACYEIADLRRAGEWTEATSRWCATMPGAGPFMGICRVHRAQVLQIRGVWDEAERELARVCEELADFDVEVVAEARYHRGDVRRLRGDLAAAAAEYREAHHLGRDPQPGMALLALAGGRVDAAHASIRSALTSTEDPLTRARLLPAAVEIALAAGDLAGAGEAAEELDRLAGTYGTTGFRAESCTARARVLLGAEQHEQALPLLRRAARAWQQLGAPFEVRRVRLLLAEAYEALGDPDAAGLERSAAEAEGARLEGQPPAPGAEARGPARGARADGLTPREAEVLALVAAGRSNQEVADELVLSVRTVERHLATVYQKLGLHGRSARAAAVGYAHREGLLAPSR